MEKPVNCESLKSNQPKDKSNVAGECLPPEMLEKIVEKLEPKYLLTWRLVNSGWKVFAEKLLENRVAGFFTKWNDKTKYNPVALCITTLRAEKDPQKDLKRKCAEIMESCTNDPSINPFPSSSLRFVQTYSRMYTPQIEIECFLRACGHHVKHLIVFAYETTPKKFCKFLSIFPNLRSLTLEGVRIRGRHTGFDKYDEYYVDDCDGSYDLKWSELPTLELLTHLRISSDTLMYSEVVTLYEDTFLSIIKKYSSQLVGLAILRSNIFWRYSGMYEKEFDSISHKVPQFEKLLQLKINPRNYVVLKFTNVACLTHLHIMSDDDVDLETKCPKCRSLYRRHYRAYRYRRHFFADGCTYCCSWDSMNGQLVQLIQPFASTLIHLRMANKICNFNPSRLTVLFPKVKVLGISVPENDDEIVAMTNFILPSFANLKTVEFTHVGKFRDLIVTMIKKVECLTVCSNLQVVSLFVVYGKTRATKIPGPCNYTIVVEEKSLEQNRDN